MIFKMVPLSDLCVKITDGAHSSPKAIDDSVYKIASVKDIKGFDIDVKSCKCISKIDFEILKKNGCVPQADDILIGKDGANFFGDIIIFRGQENIGLLSSIAIIRVDKSKVDPRFIYYYFKQPRVRKDVRDNYGSGSAIPRIILKDFRRLPVNLPDIQDQKRISSFLSTFDDKIEVNINIINKLEEQLEVIFGKLVGNELNSSGQWEKAFLTDIAVFLNGLAMQKFSPAIDEESLPVLKIKELRQGFCDANSDRCSSNIDGKYIVEDGDIIFSWSGTLAVDAWAGGRCGINQHLFKVTSEKYPKWFYYLWIKHYLNWFSQIAASKATTMGHIKRCDLERALVLIPSESELNKLSAIFSPLLELIINLKIQNRKISRIRDALLPKLLSGEIEKKQ